MARRAAIIAVEPRLGVDLNRDACVPSARDEIPLVFREMRNVGPSRVEQDLGGGMLLAAAPARDKRDDKRSDECCTSHARKGS